jgi:multiple sugar transport system substrate-binding protein
MSRREMLRMAAGAVAGGVGTMFLGACQPAQPVEEEKAPAEETKAPAEEKKAPPAEKVTVTFWDWWNMSEGASGEMFNYLTERFPEVEPNVELNLQNVPFGEYFRKFLAAHAAGDVPDAMHSSVSWGRDFYDKGALNDLMSYMEATDDVRRDNFLAGALVPSGKGPVQYGVPGEGPDHTCIFFNIDYFEEAGLTTDLKEIQDNWDWNTFVDAAKKLTVREGDEITRSGFLVGIPSRHQLSFWPACHGGAFYKEEGGQITGLAFNDGDAAIHGLNWWLDMLYESKVSQPIGPERQDWNQFLQGTTAMVLSGPWNYVNVLEQAPDMTWSAMLIPKAPYPGGRYSTDLWTNMLVIPSKAKNKDAGWTLLHFWCGLEFMIKRLEIGKWLAPRKDFYETAEYEKERQDLPVMDNVPLASEVGEAATFIQRSPIEEAIRPIVEDVMIQDRDVEGAVEEMLEKCNALMEEAGYQVS